MTAPDKPGLSNEELKPCQHEFVSDHGLQPACTKCGKVKDLEPCPFCGEIPDFESDVQEVGSQYAVECPGCNAGGPVSEYPDTACDMWDHRRSQEAPVAQVEVYRKALEAVLKTYSRVLRGSEYCETEKLVREALALLTSKPEPVAQPEEKCPKCGGDKGENWSEKKCEIGHSFPPKPDLTGPYRFSEHYRYCGPGLERMPDHVSVLELNIAFAQGQSAERAKWEKMKLIQALLTSKPEPVAPVRKWEAGEVVGERRCANPDCDTTH